jgi:type I restriction enzyme S subunit
MNPSMGNLLDHYFSSPANTYNYLNPLVHRGAKNTMNIGNKEFLNGQEIFLPVSAEEQQKIADFLTTIDEIINLIQGKSKQVKKI